MKMHHDVDATTLEKASKSKRAKAVAAGAAVTVVTVVATTAPIHVVGMKMLHDCGFGGC